MMTTVGKVVEKMESFYTIGRNINCCSHYGKIVWSCLKKLKIGLAYDSAIPFLDIYLKGTKPLS